MSTDPKIIPLKGMRGMIADGMMKSLQTAAQLTHQANADASGLIAHKAQLAQDGTKVSIEDLLMLAVIRAVQKNPGGNGRVEGREVHLHSSIDLSVAIALPDDLLVAPTIFGAGEMDVAQLRTARQDLAARARNNKLSVTEMTGGTFTISNLGLTRVMHFTPILNSPQICILGIGCLFDQAVRGDTGDIELHPHVGLSLTFDHRALNGAPAGALLTTICEEIEGLGR